MNKRILGYGLASLMVASFTFVAFPSIVSGDIYRPVDNNGPWEAWTGDEIYFEGWRTADWGTPPFEYRWNCYYPTGDWTVWSENNYTYHTYDVEDKTAFTVRMEIRDHLGGTGRKDKSATIWADEYNLDAAVSLPLGIHLEDTWLDFTCWATNIDEQYECPSFDWCGRVYVNRWIDNETVWYNDPPHQADEHIGPDVTYEWPERWWADDGIYIVWVHTDGNHDHNNGGSNWDRRVFVVLPRP